MVICFSFLYTHSNCNEIWVKRDLVSDLELPASLVSHLCVTPLQYNSLLYISLTSPVKSAVRLPVSQSEISTLFTILLKYNFHLNLEGGHITMYCKQWQKNSDDESALCPQLEFLQVCGWSGWGFSDWSGQPTISQARSRSWSWPSEQGCCIWTTTVSTVTSSSLLSSSSSSYSEDSWSWSERDAPDIVPKEWALVEASERSKGVLSDTSSFSSGPLSPSSDSESESPCEGTTFCLHTGHVFLVLVSQGSTHLLWYAEGDNKCYLLLL